MPRIPLTRYSCWYAHSRHHCHSSTRGNFAGNLFIYLCCIPALQHINTSTHIYTHTTHIYTHTTHIYTYNSTTHIYTHLHTSTHIYTHTTHIYTHLHASAHIQHTYNSTTHHHRGYTSTSCSLAPLYRHTFTVHLKVTLHFSFSLPSIDPTQWERCF